MTGRRLDFLPADCDPTVRAVTAYWAGLPTASPGVPLRSDFDPVALPPRVLPHIWMVDLERDPDRFRFRLCGSHLVRVLGFDPTGRYYEEVFPGFAATETFAALVRVRDTGEGSWRSGGAEPGLSEPRHQASRARVSAAYQRWRAGGHRAGRLGLPYPRLGWPARVGTARKSMKLALI